jgi:magnesium chelatase subunit I
MLVFTANPEDYTARGKIITPLKDRIGAEIRTHYPGTLAEGMSITSQESWSNRGGVPRLTAPGYIREIIEEVAFHAREDKRIDKRSGVSQRLPISCLENALSNAEQRAVRNHETSAAARVADIYSAIPAMTGKFELEYEGEMKGAENIARELIRSAVGKVFTRHFADANFQPLVQFFEGGGDLKVPAGASAAEHCAQLRTVPGLFDLLGALNVKANQNPAEVASAAEFILEGLWAHKRISRSEERGYFAEARKAPESREAPNRNVPRRQFN